VCGIVRAVADATIEAVGPIGFSSFMVTPIACADYRCRDRRDRYVDAILLMDFRPLCSLLPQSRKPAQDRRRRESPRARLARRKLVRANLHLPGNTSGIALLGQNCTDFPIQLIQLG
jgi:hypothetical protein